MSRARRISSALGLLSILAILSACDGLTGSDAKPFVPDPARLNEATVLHFTLSGDSITAASANRSTSGALLSLVGRDVIDASTTGLTRTPIDKKRDLVRFDLSLVNRISGHELRPPTGTPGPAVANSIFAFPYTITVTGGSGTVTTSSDWPGAPFTFFGDASTNCKGPLSANCFVWQSFNAPLRPNQPSEAHTVGFVIDKSVTSFDVYLLVSTDIVKIPTGTVAVTVSSALRGPIPAVHVQMDGTIDAVTGPDGVATFADAIIGDRTITIPSAPQGCTAPAPTTATVVASQTTNVSLDLSCTPAALGISENTLAFGGIVVGTASPIHTFTISNTGGSPSTALTTGITGAQAADFTISRNLCANAVVAPGESCQIDVALQPSAAGARAATLTVSATQGGTVTSDLSGQGLSPAHLSVDATTFNFGAQGVGSTSAPHTFTITNDGGLSTGVLALALGGANAADFSIATTNCTVTLDPGASCTVGVAAAPSTTDARNATLTVSATPGGSAAVTLAAAGVRAAELTLTPTSFDFGSAVIATSSAPQTFTLKNTGGGTTGALTIAVSGSDATQFTVDPAATTCGAPLAGGATCAVVVRLTPTTSGAKSASLEVTGAPGGTVTSSLAGRGLTPAALSIDRGSNAFGGVITGGSAATTFTITNTGEATANEIVVTFDGTDASQFTQSGGSCGASLDGGQSCTVQVSFNPASLGAKSATVHVTAAPGGAVQATLSGTGIKPAQLVSSDTTFDFGNVLEGSFPQHTITITNVGDVPTGQIQSFNRFFGNLFVSDECGFRTLQPGQSCSIFLEWNVTPGPIDFFIQDFASPGGFFSVRVKGNGLKQAAIAISPSSFNFGNVATGSGTADQTFTVSNSGDVPSGTPTVTFTPASADLTMSNNGCTAAIPAGGNCTITVHFAPTTPGSKSATLAVATSPGGSPSVSISGFATAPAQLQLNATSADLGTLTLGGNIDRSFTLSNVGTVTSGTLTTTLTTSEDYSIVGNNCPTALPGLQSCTITVRYLPFNAGTSNATLSVSGTPGGSLSASLTAVGVAPSAGTLVAVLSVDFGAANYGQSVTKSITFKNVGLATVNVIATGGSSAFGAFTTVGQGCLGASLAPGASCTQTVSFSPATANGQNPTSWTGQINIQYVLGQVGRVVQLSGHLPGF